MRKPILLVLAAGIGSRFGGVKQLASVGPNGEGLLDYAAYDALKAGFSSIVFIIRRDIESDFREKIFDRLSSNINASYVFQDNDMLFSPSEAMEISARKKPWGTSHAVLCARDKLNSPFAIINADDYYGRSAFETMARYLSTLEEGGTEHAMVGYVLENTLSLSGSVTRGLCEVKDNKLLSVNETFEIKRSEGGIDSSRGKLTGKEWASMNLFGFNVSALPFFEECWLSFKKDFIHSQKEEALLPEFVERMISAGRGTVNFFTSTEKWFGMTYPQDLQEVRLSITEKIKGGYYPENLWK